MPYRIVVLILVLGSLCAGQVTRHVAAGAMGALSGTAADPFDSIQAAVAVAVGGDTILVGPGTYHERVDYQGKNLVIRAVAGAGQTTIDAGGAGSAVLFANGEGASAVLEGFTLTGGVGTTVNVGMPVTVGGGVCVVGASPVLRRCIFSGNTGVVLGGGLFLTSSNATVLDCRFVGNDAHWGGGLFISYASPTLTNVVVANNVATTGCGGGLFCWDDSSVIRHATIHGNSAVGWGGGLVAVGTSQFAVDHSIVWGNTPDAAFVLGGTPTIVYSDVEGGWPGAGNVDATPGFFHAAGGDYRLVAGSPCIDAGDPGATPFVATDLDGEPRQGGVSVDLGCDEYHGVFLGAAAAGSLGDVLTIDGSAGGPARRVDVSQGVSATLELDVPAAAPGLPYVMFGLLGSPGPAEATTLPGSLGVMAFAPCVLAPADPAGFVAVDGAGLGLCGGPGGPALPLTITAPPIVAPIRITLQAVVAVSATDWQVSNGLIFNVP